jgi:hypothetical protein
MPRRHVVLALVVAVCWAVNFVVIDIGLESFPPLLFAALRFGLTAFAKAGTYEYICNVAGHAAAGMKGLVNESAVEDYNAACQFGTARRGSGAGAIHPLEVS